MNKFLALIFLVALFSFYWFLFRPTATDLNHCFEDSARGSQQILEEVQKGEWSKSQVCENGEQLMNALRSCLAEVKGRHIMYSPVMRFSGVKGKADSLVNQHNRVCSRNSVAPIE